MKNQIILIAGGSGGVGTACAHLMSKAGAKIVLAARNREKAEETAREINNKGGEAYVTYLDVTDAGSVGKMVEQIKSELGRIDVLVNAFGLGMIKPLHDASTNAIKEVIDVNVTGTILVTKAVTELMAEEKSGKVVMLPGILGKAVMKHSSVYSASKFAVSGFTKALVDEHRRSGIHYSLLYLGGISTDFWENDEIEMRVQKDKMLTAEEVAKAVYYAVSQPGPAVLNELVIQPESHQMT